MVGGGDAEKLLRALTGWYQKRFEAAEAIHDHNEAVARLSRATGTSLLAPEAAAPAPPAPSKPAETDDRPRRREPASPSPQ